MTTPQTMRCLDEKISVFKIFCTALIILTICRQSRGLRRQCHVMIDVQKYLHLVCDVLRIPCNEDYDMNCPHTGPIKYIPDKEVDGAKFTGRSYNTLPSGFIIRPSSILNAGTGVFTLDELPVLTMIGPYYGEIIPNHIKHTSTLLYAWDIRKYDETHHLVDGGNEEMSSYMRYINSPNTEDGANLVAIQMKGHMHYKTLRHIPACTELLVWYGDAYGEYLASLHEDEDDHDKGYDEYDDDDDIYDVDVNNSLKRGAADKSLWEEWKLKLQTLTRNQHTRI